MTKQENYYNTLGVAPTADDRELRRGYFKKSLLWHPDKRPDDENEQANEDFARLSNAYEVLKDPWKRMEFDILLQIGAVEETDHGLGEQTECGSGDSENHDADDLSSNGENQGDQKERSSDSEKQEADGLDEQTGRSSDTSEKQVVCILCANPNTSSNQQGTSSSSDQVHPEQSSGAKNEVPKPSSSSKAADSDSLSSQGSSCNEQMPSDDREESSNGNAIFGINKTDGKPCRRCQTKGGFCYQHLDQDPNIKKSSTYTHKKVYGRRKSDGEPCRRCINQGGFCYQHKDQEQRGNGKVQHKDQEQRGNAKVYGIRADGKPCKRCIQQKRFCHQHKSQEAA